jgi:hypothetical protein
MRGTKVIINTVIDKILAATEWVAKEPGKATD